MTSIGCALLLLRGFRQSRMRLLFWASVCFACLALNNLMLFVDLVVLPAVELPLLSVTRSLVALAGVMVLIYGLVWDSR